MTTLSVAVIGAGPAGTTAARILAGRGARVTLFEARSLPRPKACGGGLTPKAQRLVPPFTLGVVDRRVHRVELRGGRLSSVYLAAPGAEIAMVDRSTFDMAMAEAAATAGADIRDGVRVDTVVEDDRGVTLTARGRVHRADVLLAADGEPSSVARRLGLGGTSARRSLALAIDTPFASTVPRDTAILSLTVPGGYAWYFPKGGHASVGVMSSWVGTAETFSGVLKPALDRMLNDLGLSASDGHVAGHWIPQALRQGSLASRRVILAGDAAATADPLFGEGISFAMQSAVVASAAIADMESGAIMDLRPFESRLRASFKPPMRRLRLAVAVADRSPTLALAAVRLSPWVRGYAEDAVSGRRHPFKFD
jgi:geranylgeranyl reductase family protein